MKSDVLVDCNKCRLIRSCNYIDAIGTVTDFTCIDFGVNICSARVPSLLVWWRHPYFPYYAVLQCCGGYGVIPDSLLIWAPTTTTASENGIIRKPLVATRTN